MDFLSSLLALLILSFLHFFGIHSINGATQLIGTSRLHWGSGWWRIVCHMRLHLTVERSVGFNELPIARNVKASVLRVVIEWSLSLQLFELVLLRDNLRRLWQGLGYKLVLPWFLVPSLILGRLLRRPCRVILLALLLTLVYATCRRQLKRGFVLLRGLLERLEVDLFRRLLLNEGMLHLRVLFGRVDWMQWVVYGRDRGDHARVVADGVDGELLVRRVELRLHG